MIRVLFCLFFFLFLQICNSVFDFCRPHPKDGRRYCFQFVCQSIPRLGGGESTPIPGQDGGYPIPDQDGVPPTISRMGYHPMAGWGYSLSAGWGDPPSQVKTGGSTPNWNSIACTCYAAGGMPLAFTQEDFLVLTAFEKYRFLRFGMSSGI